MANSYFKNPNNSVDYNKNFQTILFHLADFTWQSEALSTFIDQFFNLLPSASPIEVIEGADRMSARFHYQQTDFVINLECICESIWIEPYTNTQIGCLKALYQELDSQIQVILNE